MDSTLNCIFDFQFESQTDNSQQRLQSFQFCSNSFTPVTCNFWTQTDRQTDRQTERERETSNRDQSVVCSHWWSSRDVRCSYTAQSVWVNWLQSLSLYRIKVLSSRQSNTTVSCKEYPPVPTTHNTIIKVKVKVNVDLYSASSWEPHL